MRIIKALNRVEELFIGISILTVTIILFVNVVLRYIFSSSMTWVEEFTRYGIIWVTFVGSSVCVYKAMHLGIDSVLSAIFKKDNKFIASLVPFIGVAFSLLFTILATKMTMQVYEGNELSSTIGISMAYIYAAMPVGGCLMTIKYVERLLHVLLAKGGTS